MTSWYQDPPKALLIDDDPDLLNLLTIAFRGAGFETECASNGTAALLAMEHGKFSLIVLDINMPGPNGYHVCAAIRRNSKVPILMLSARSEEQDMLEALEVGADAYLAKPFSPRTLIARSQALLRRAEMFDSPAVIGGKFKLDINELMLRHPGGDIQLTKIEARVLRLLIDNAERVVPGGEVMAEVWSTYRGTTRNMLKQVIFRLRRKLSIAPDVRRALKSVGGGYMWSERADGDSDVPIIRIDDAGSVTTS